MIINEKLSSIEINPTGRAERCIIWLHGLGADGNDFVPIVPELRIPPQLNTRFIFPNAPVMPVTINNGYEMPAWFDIYAPDLGAKVDTRGIEQSVLAINTLIQHEQAQGVPAANIMLAGFSQGALIALTTGILYPERLAGIIALSGMLPQADTLIRHASPANRDLPIFIAHGTEDNIVPLSMGRAAYTALTNAAYPVTWHDYAMPHSVCGQEIGDISNWIRKIWV
jgi:phospholipase/carboxylesterase